MGNRINNVGKPRCFKGFHIARNNVKRTIFGAAEPTWDFKACAAPRSEGHFAGGDRWQFGDHLDPANEAVRVQQVLFSLLLTRPARFTTGGKAQNASCSFFLERFCVFGFQRVAGRRPSLVQESILPPSRPRIPPTSRKKG